MVRANFLPSNYKRNVNNSSELILRNRYFEQNPALSDDGAALLARPGMRKWLEIGEGPIRGMHSSPGAFDGDLFVVSGTELYRINSLSEVTYISGSMYNPDLGFINMAITANIGTTPEYLFIADGRNLWLYVENGYATGTVTGTPADNDVVTVMGIYYKFTSGSVDTGTPAGTSGNPYLVALGSTAADAWTNLSAAFSANGTGGTQYSTAISAANSNILVTATNSTSISVRSTLIGSLGNSTTTTETGSAISWTNGATLTGGGDASITTVEIPDAVGVADVAVISSYVIVLPVQGEGINGVFYWIEPGETTINPLNYATAEQSPDAVFSVEVVGDQFMLPGENTTEVWYVTGDPSAPMRRLTGVVFDRGTWEGTAASLNEAIFICDADGAVFLISQGMPKRISTPDIEELIRKAIQNQQNLT